MRGLTDLHKAGQIGEDETKLLTTLIHQGHKLLTEWEINVRNGQVTTYAIEESLNSVVRDLIAFELERKGN